MAHYYKMVVKTEYYNEVIIKANSLKEAKSAEESILKRIDLMGNTPEINVETYERTDYDDGDVDVDLTKYPIDKAQ